MIKRILIASMASAFLMGGIALAVHTGNDNGHGDHGCHIGEQNNDVIINPHCPSPSPSPSVSVSPSTSPEPSESPTASPSPSPSPSATPSPSASPATPTSLSGPTVLPAVGGTGKSHR